MNQCNNYYDIYINCYYISIIMNYSDNINLLIYV